MLSRKLSKILGPDFCETCHKKNLFLTRILLVGRLAIVDHHTFSVLPNICLENFATRLEVKLYIKILLIPGWYY